MGDSAGVRSSYLLAWPQATGGYLWQFSKLSVYHSCVSGNQWMQTHKKICVCTWEVHHIRWLFLGAFKTLKCGIKCQNERLKNVPSNFLPVVSAFSWFWPSKANTLRLLNALNSEDRGLKVRFPCNDSIWQRISSNVSNTIVAREKHTFKPLPSLFSAFSNLKVVPKIAYDFYDFLKPYFFVVFQAHSWPFWTLRTVTSLN